MPARFVIDLVATPSPAVIAKGLFIASEKLNDLGEPLQRAGEVVRREIDENFQVEGRPSPWEPLADSTLSRKDSQGLDDRILRATGALYEGLMNPGIWDISVSGNEGVATMADPTGYGELHINGTWFMHIRDYTFVTDEGLEEIDEIFYQWIEEIESVIPG